MKTMKKLFAVLLAAAMVMAMGVTAFAAEGDENNETTTNQTKYQYEIYQIFTGDYHNGVLSNVKWGKNGKYVDNDGNAAEEGDPVPAEVLKELEALVPKEGSRPSDREKLDVILKYANLSDEAFQKDVDGTGDTLTVENLPDGYYLVKDVDGSQNGGENNKDTAYTTYVVQVVDGTLTIQRKVGVPTVDKKIVEETTENNETTTENNETTTENNETTTTKSETNEASIGDTVKYEITGTLPSNLADYNTYYYEFTDTLSKGLTYTANTLKVMVDGNDLTTYFYVVAKENKDEEENVTSTTITVAIKDLLALNQLKDGNAIQDEEGNDVEINITAASNIVIKYSATLNENAVIAGDGNPNTVKLTYSNNPNDSGKGDTTPPPENPNKPETSHPTGETPDKTVVTYTTEITITKEDEKGNILAGAEFTLTGNDVNIVLVTKVTFEPSENGEYWKLKDGTYTTEEPTRSVIDENGDVTIEGNEDDYADLEQKYIKKESIDIKDTSKENVSAVGEVDPSTGKLTFTGLGAGDYIITESKTPAGYNTIAPIEFTITFNSDTKEFVSSNNEIIVGTDNKLDTTIVNESGALLPSTGGMGTTLIYLLGAALAVGAGVLLVVRRRMSAEK